MSIKERRPIVQPTKSEKILLTENEGKKKFCNDVNHVGNRILDNEFFYSGKGNCKECYKRLMNDKNKNNKSEIEDDEDILPPMRKIKNTDDVNELHSKLDNLTKKLEMISVDMNNKIQELIQEIEALRV